MKTPLIKKSTFVLVCVILILCSSVLSIIFPNRTWGIVSTAFTFILVCSCYFADKVAKLFGYFFAQKDICPYYLQTDCPYCSNKQCPYDTSFCQNGENKKRRGRCSFWVILLFVLSVLLSVFSVLIESNVFQEQRFDWEIWLKICSPIANSVIAAILCAYIMDIPSRMTEYQDYFTRLLSSPDYLKVMDEDDLIDLRRKVLWQLHIKDVPRMPKGLIKLDERILDMLKNPYFKTYNQIIQVKDIAESPGSLKKIVTVEYLAHNPYPNDHAVKMDVGLANSVKFVADINEETAKKLFIIKKFTVTVGDQDTPINLLPQVDVLIHKKSEEGLLYNGVIEIGKKQNHGSDNTLDISQPTSNDNEVIYRVTEGEDISKLWLEFRDKIKVRLEYEVTIPEDDNIYTKRLRYPVKYFHLDYSIDSNLHYKLVGQLIGTLLDQQDVSHENLNNDCRIHIRTNNWLLPKNGAIIVHCKQRDK